MMYKDIFSSIYENYGFGSTESRSGPGSTLSETEKLRKKIVDLVKNYDIKSVLDIPCGDFNWMKEIVDNFYYYTGGDIVDKCIISNNENYSRYNINFINFDLLKDKFPKNDLLIVRDVIGHFPIQDGLEIVKNIINSDCKYLLTTTWYNINDDNYFKHHKNKIVDYGRFYPVNLMSNPFNFPKPIEVIEEDVFVDNYDIGVRKVLAFWKIDDLKSSVVLSEPQINSKPKSKVTLVTGLWDLGRDKLNEGWSRPFSHYLSKLEQLLKIEENLIIFGDKELKEFVFNHRSTDNTQFVERPLNWFKENSYFDLIQKIRLNESWYNQVGWLSDSTQSKLEYYNPIVMSKIFLLHDAKIIDKFDSEYLFWIDAGLTSTVHSGYFTHDKVFDKISKYISKFSFICFPYDAVTEIHGFEYNKLCNMAGDHVNKVARGGFFGGPKETISEINSIYYGLLNSTLSEGYMGTEESLFTIMTYKHSDLINYFEIENNGLIGHFFENLKNESLSVKSENKNFSVNKLDINKVGLYVMTFNSPNQFRTLIQSMLEYDKNYISKTKKFLLDNSTDLSTSEQYSDICREYDFEHIKKDNLGICGGRQWISEHFENETDLDYYLFFEDDMFFYPKQGTCRNGFNRFVKNLYNISLEICKNYNFDFLKLNYSEFFGDNGTQWAWYNVPQNVREEFWPDKKRLPEMGLDPNAPKAVYSNIISHKGVPFTNGDVYYCNWPQIVSKHGNKKMFLDTKWAHPFEQTWMSHMYQLTKKGELNPGLLLLTPTEHNRFDHYGSGLRKES
jgi:SAM-dependent methyltransferase